MTNDKIRIVIDIDLEDLVPGYIAKRINEVPIMRELVLNKDLKELKTIGHKLKGNAGGYGFNQLGLYGAIIEEAATTNDLEIITKTIQEIENYLSHIDIVYEQID